MSQPSPHLPLGARLLLLVAGGIVLLPVLFLAIMLPFRIVAPGSGGKIVEAVSPTGRFAATIESGWEVVGYDTTVTVWDLTGDPGKEPRGGKTLLTAEGDMSRYAQYIFVDWQDESTLVVEYYPYARPYGIHSEPWHGLNIMIREREAPPLPTQTLPKTLPTPARRESGRN